MRRRRKATATVLITSTHPSCAKSPTKMSSLSRSPTRQADNRLLKYFGVISEHNQDLYNNYQERSSADRRSRKSYSFLNEDRGDYNMTNSPASRFNMSPQDYSLPYYATRNTAPVNGNSLNDSVPDESFVLPTIEGFSAETPEKKSVSDA